MSVRLLHRNSAPPTKHNKTKTNRTNPNRPHKTTRRQDNKWKGNTWSNSVNEHRKQAIYQDIMDGTFNANRYTSSVAEGHCVYHSCIHTGGNAQCAAMQKIFAKAAIRGYRTLPFQPSTPHSNNNNLRYSSSFTKFLLNLNPSYGPLPRLILPKPLPTLQYTLFRFKNHWNEYS